MLRQLCLLALLLAPQGCGGQNNAADCDKGQKPMPCSARTKEEDARLALNGGDYDTAIDLLAQLVADEPDTYSRYPLLAAAYAARAGLDILNIAKAQFGSGASLLDQMSAFVPRPSPDDTRAFTARLSDMQSAVATLHLIPASALSSAETDAYTASVTLQLTLYTASYSVMYLSKFTTNAATGTTDLSQLQNMSEDDAVAILSSLSSAADIPQLAGNEALQAKVNDALAAINAEPGGTTKEKLAAFMQANQGSDSAP